ncbi:MAG: hypothetical protein DME08_13385 [Candidatus Rokuibacteriota bacterium]|nr:MAG: hypothetical protein DME08_13385 [Candidatus Rokubacteria bacterium]
MDRRQLGALAAALLVGAAPAAWGHQPSPAASPGGRLTTAPSLAVIRPAPDFALPDVAGTDVKLSERLTEARLLPGEVTLLSVTVDPERDSAAVLARYAQAFTASPRGWRFLRSEPDRLGPVLARYDEWTKRLPNGDIDHPARLYLIDRAGRIREIYSLGLFDERQAFLDIQALLREPR